MAEALTVARPYAEAVFRLAREQNQVDVWSRRLQALALIAQDAEMAALINNPRLSDEHLAELFIHIGGSVESEIGQQPELKRFLLTLAENQRLALLTGIATLFDLQKNADQGVSEALVESAFELGAEQLGQLRAELERHFGSKLEISVATKPELIGGVLVKVGDQVLDLSVRGKLEAMSHSLKH